HDRRGRHRLLHPRCPHHHHPDPSAVRRQGAGDRQRGRHRGHDPEGPGAGGGGDLVRHPVSPRVRSRPPRAQVLRHGVPTSPGHRSRGLRQGRQRRHGLVLLHAMGARPLHQARHREERLEEPEGQPRVHPGPGGPAAQGESRLPARRQVSPRAGSPGLPRSVHPAHRAGENRGEAVRAEGEGRLRAQGGLHEGAGVARRRMPILPELVLQLVNGFVWGWILALLALGLTLVFGLLEVVNIAHGALYAFGAITTWYWTRKLGSFWLSLAVTPPLVGALGLAAYVVTVRPVESTPISTVIATFRL